MEDKLQEFYWRDWVLPLWSWFRRNGRESNQTSP